MDNAFQWIQLWGDSSTFTILVIRNYISKIAVIPPIRLQYKMLKATSVFPFTCNCIFLLSPPLQVVQYLAGCGLQSCLMLVSKGYPDIGWNPVEGERYLDFLRFAVFCNGNLPTF